MGGVTGASVALSAMGVFVCCGVWLGVWSVGPQLTSREHSTERQWKWAERRRLAIQRPYARIGDVRRGECARSWILNGQAAMVDQPVRSSMGRQALPRKRRAMDNGVGRMV
jgi:hypothetical protein